MPKRKDKEPTNDFYDEDNINTDEYYELLSELYPSNYINEKKKKTKAFIDDSFLNNIRDTVNYLSNHLTEDKFKELNKCEPNLCPVKDTPFILLSHLNR